MIVVAGESLVDLLLAPDGTLAARPGGAPFNVARGVARLGVDCAFCGAISEDAFGRAALAALREDGVDTSLVQASPLPTTLALAELGPAGASYRFYTEGTAAPSLSGGKPGDALYVGGLGLVLEPMASAVMEMVDAAEGLVFLDPNVRPAAPVAESEWRERLARVLARADVVKVSTEDLVLLGVRDARSLAREDALVLVTDGPDPARAFWRGEEFVAEAPAVEVADTVGAGDSFSAALLAWRARRGLDDVEGALGYAVRAAAITCTRPGADPPREAELL